MGFTFERCYLPPIRFKRYGMYLPDCRDMVEERLCRDLSFEGRIYAGEVRADQLRSAA